MIRVIALQWRQYQSVLSEECSHSLQYGFNSVNVRSTLSINTCVSNKIIGAGASPFSVLPVMSSTSFYFSFVSPVPRFPRGADQSP